MRYIHHFAITIELPASPGYPEDDDRMKRKEQLRQLAAKNWPEARVLYIDTKRVKD